MLRCTRAEEEISPHAQGSECVVLCNATRPPTIARSWGVDWGQRRTPISRLKIDFEIDLEQLLLHGERARQGKLDELGKKRTRTNFVQ